MLAPHLGWRTLRVAAAAAMPATRASLHEALTGENLRRRTALSLRRSACRYVRRASIEEDQPVLDETRERAAQRNLGGAVQYWGGGLWS
jgi:hypothetical protein